MIHWLEDIDERDASRLGTKAANLASLLEHGFDVPKGFVIEASFFQDLLTSQGVKDRIEQELDQVDVEDLASLREASTQIQRMIDDVSLPDDAVEEIEDAYENINISQKVRNAGDKAVELVGGQRETEFVAVRGHATDDSPGVYDTYIGVNGKDSVRSKIREAWKSYYSPEAIYYRAKRGNDAPFTVLVQKMVEPEISGTVFTRDPFDGTERIVVESMYGIGSALSRGSVIPDRYVVDRASGRLESIDVAEKSWKIERDPSTGSTVKHRVPSDQQDERSLDADDLSDTVRTALDIEKEFDRPVRVEFSIGRNKTYILDVSGVEEAAANMATDAEEQETLLEGTPVSSGQASGAAAVIYEAGETEELDPNRVAVGINAEPNLLPLIGQGRAAVTDKGGMASSAAVLARTFDTPLIAGCGNATDILSSGEDITVDCNSGAVIEGNEPATTDETEHADGPSPVTAEQQPVNALTATSLLTINERVEDADGTVAMRYTDVDDPEWVLEAGKPENRIHRSMPDDFRGGGLLVEDYATVLRLEEAVERQASSVFLDVDALAQDGEREAVEQAIRKAVQDTDDRECAVIVDSPDDRLIGTAVEAGVDSLVVPPEDFHDVQQRVERAERSFMLERLREL